MTDIAITDLTNKTDVTDGTGVFDILMKSIDLHLTDQFTLGRITGVEYSTVYLGALQSVLQQSLTFLLSEQKASKEIELLAQQIIKAQEETDLIIAQTAKAYEDIAATKAATVRENLINAEQIIETQEKVDLLQSQDLETIAKTTRMDSESAQKVTLMAAQTLGFASDTKQKVLKQMFENYAVNLSIAGVGNVPEAAQDTAIDNLVENILSEVGVTEIINSAPAIDLGIDTPPLPL